ncbi:MAG: putative methyltransferase, partial [Ilumatobacteraceae bacterium]|nr:putative methyltransferase [Ilumatobacteraceae bacterium]
DVPVVLVEGSSSACGDARHNLAGRSATIVETTIEQWEPCPAQVVIADPSRRGLGVEAAQRLTATGADTLVLVSCDPVSLARDAVLLSDHYRLTDSVVVDLFPQTHHVEVVSKFERHSRADSEQ